MNRQLTSKKPVITKSKTIKFLAIILLTLLPGFANASLMFGVTFGQPQDNGGECVGKGVCKESFDLNPATNIYGSQPEAVSVTFQLSPNDANVLMMSFSLSELKQKQSAQGSNFSDGGNYYFDGAFALTGSEFASLNLPANSQITPNSSNTVQVSGDFVTVSYTYSHD